MRTYLASGVDNFCRKLLSLVTDGLAKRVLDGRVVAIDEVSVDELDGKRRLAWVVAEGSAKASTS